MASTLRQLSAILALAIFLSTNLLPAATTQPAPPVARPAPKSFTPVPGWRAKEDTYQQSWRAKPDLRLTLPIKNRGEILGSSRPSPYVVVADRDTFGKGADNWNILDVRTATWPFRINNIAIPLENPTISPDAKYLAGIVKPAKFTDPATLEVWTVKAPARVRAIEAGARSRSVSILGFLDDDQLLTMTEAKSFSDPTTVNIWDLKGKSDASFTIKGRIEPSQVALSPNGKLLAVFQEKKLQIFSLPSGDSLGETTVPEETKPDRGYVTSPSLEDLTFSLDGCEVGGLFYQNLKFRIVTWDLPTGQVITDITFDKPESLRDESHPSFEINPDNSGFRIGLVLVDRDAGKPVYVFPNPVPDSTFQHNSYMRLFDGERLVFAATTSAGRAGILALEIPKKQVAAAADAIKAGGKVSDVGLPPLTPADASTARPIGAGKGGPWTLKPDTSAPSPAKTNIQQIPLRFIAGHAGQIAPQAVAFAGAASPRAAVAYHTFNNNNDRSTPRVAIERINLDNGGILSTFEAPVSTARLLDLSSNGRQFALISDDRLDLYEHTAASAPAKHVVGFRPCGSNADTGLKNPNRNRYSYYSSFSGTNSTVHWAAILDAANLLTLSNGGQVILWSLPECHGVYSFQTQHAPALSPNRRQLAFHDDVGITIIDPLSGAELGSLLIGTNTPRGPIAFHPDGTLLATVTNSATAEVLVWDLTNGKLVTEFGLPCALGGPVSWAGRKHLMIGDALIDLERRIILWRFAPDRAGYSTERVTMLNPPDDRYWSHIAGSGRQAPAIVATPLPQEEARKAATALVAADLLILQPDMKVSLDINIVGSEATKKEIITNLTRTLADNGITVADNQPLHLVATTTQTGSRSEQLAITRGPFRSFGKPESVETVSAPTYENKLALTLDGKSVWEIKGTYMGSIYTGTLNDGESGASKTAELNTEPARGFFSSLHMPRYLAKGSPDGLGYSELTTRGPLNIPRPVPPPNAPH